LSTFSVIHILLYEGVKELRHVPKLKQVGQLLKQVKRKWHMAKQQRAWLKWKSMVPLNSGFFVTDLIIMKRH